MDNVDKAVRSKIMSTVGQKNTQPEILLRRGLHKLGFRYRLHDKRLPGSPDIVLPRYRAAIFVHGCFWHRHGCKKTSTPKTNSEFWYNKFVNNCMRDKRHYQALKKQGWRVAVIWECELLKYKRDNSVIVEIIKNWLDSNEKKLVIPQKNTRH